MRLRLTLLSVAALPAMACVLLAGCSSAPSAGTDSSNPSADADASSTGDPGLGSGSGSTAKVNCALAPASVIKATLNLSVQEPTQVTNDSVIACTYAPGADGHTVIVRFQTDEDAGGFTRGRQGFDANGQPTTDVTGLLDQAYSSSTEFGDIITNTLVARKGSVEVLVTADATLAAEKALITQIVSSLG